MGRLAGETETDSLELMGISPQAGHPLRGRIMLEMTGGTSVSKDNFEKLAAGFNIASKDRALVRRSPDRTVFGIEWSLMKM